MFTDSLITFSVEFCSVKILIFCGPESKFFSKICISYNRSQIKTAFPMTVCTCHTNPSIIPIYLYFLRKDGFYC